MIWNLILVIFGTIIVFFLSQITHELSHYLLAMIHGAKARIEMCSWNGIPSMRCVVTKGNPGELFYYAGIFNAILLLFLGWIFSLHLIILTASLYINSCIQLFYGTFEGLTIKKLSFDIYMKLHYIVYLIGLIVGLILTFKIWT